MIPPDLLPSFLSAYVFTPLLVLALAGIGVYLFVRHVDRQHPPAE